MNLISQYKGLRKENYVLCFGRFVTAMGAMVRPMLTVLFEPDKDQIPQIMERIFLQYYKLYEGADKILDYYRASKGAFLCIQKNKRILHYGYIIKQSL